MTRKRLRPGFYERGPEGIAAAVRDAEDCRYFFHDKAYQEPDTGLGEVVYERAAWLWALMLFLDWVNE